MRIIVTRHDRYGTKYQTLFPLLDLQPRLRRIHLEVKSNGLDSLLLIAAQLGKTVGERVRNSDIHIGSSLGLNFSS